MRIDNRELLKQLKEWSDNDETARIVSAARLLPLGELDDEALTIIADAYIEEKEYKKAVNVLEIQRERLDGDYHWHFRLGMALYFAALDLKPDSEKRADILERAQVSFARCMNLNPPENVLDEAGNFLDLIESERGENEDENEDYQSECELYDEEDLYALEDHIEEYFGEFPTIFHEISSPDIHCDIYIVPPTEKRDYYTLITVGMGAHIMNVPEELSEEENGRAELLMCLPKNWKIGENADEWFWPMSLLKNIARLPIYRETWLGWGHTVDNKKPFAENTKLCGTLLVYPEDADDGAEVCKLPSGDKVNFFEVVPLYREELDFKIDHDANALLEKLDVSHIVDINRRNVCRGYIKDGIIDSARIHSEKISEKKLPLDEINGCNHIAMFLHWCIEHGLHNKYFFRNHEELVKRIADGEFIDLRSFILDNSRGDFTSRYLSLLGYMFTRRYYDRRNRFDDCFYPRDVDKCAEEYFGTEKYNSEEFQDEAYMFAPFDEGYYHKLSRYIDKAFDIFFNEYTDYNYNDSLPLVIKTEKIFGCKLEFNKYQIEAYYDSRRNVRLCKQSGEYPVTFIITELKPDERTYDDAERLSHILNACNEPFFFTIATAKSAENILEKFYEKDNTIVLKSPALKESCRELKRYFGIKPVVLEFSKKSVNIMLPSRNGEYILLKGKKI